MKRLLISTFCLLLAQGIMAQDLSKVYQNVVDGVVVIMTRENEVFRQSGRTQQMAVGGLGTGFMVDELHIMTAAHVVQTAETIVIKFHDGEEIPADVVSNYGVADVALLKLKWKSKNGKVLKLGDSDKMKVGEQIFIVGTPLGLSHSFSSGYISGRQMSSKRTSAIVKAEFLQTDAAINHGNSGGPMFNTKGEVVGIVSYILSESGGFEGIGFAATSNIAQDLLFDGHAMWTGISGNIVSGDLAKILNIPQPEGYLVEKVVLLSPIGLMGVKGGSFRVKIEDEELILGGDIILEINGVKISTNSQSLEQLGKVLSSENQGNLELKVFREGKIVTLKAQ